MSPPQNEKGLEASLLKLALLKGLRADGPTGGAGGEGAAGTKEKADRRPRDPVTGRRLAEDGEKCVRCAGKGLRCTLSYVGAEGAARCGGCRRAGAPYCVRRQGRASRRVAFAGPPWKDPNYFAVVGDGEAAADEPDGGRAAAVEAILRAHFLGPDTYVHGGGEYRRAADLARLALPPLPPAPARKTRETRADADAGWRRVLPIWQNTSLRAGRGGGAGEDGPEAEERQDDALKYLRTARKYWPRRAHLKEELADLGETW
ncbi:hypothetical protein GGS23DRAFT_608677 [Durotheca rogersii]|uniref:uncharacterized protein n=1 Tax=Durotheca rogersii TaxID=419775 RepID=UPI0022201457|nr:uncharacterized protein GGS23DRAFT_608677 [Durotheca rogersii]KAI5868116.1 hypothetical protein GGS23DRAFT_608677 [Durotheca rogersii]